MIYKLFICAVLTLLGGFLFGQETVKSSAKIYYAFTHIDDTTQPDNPYTEDIVVLLSPEVSLQKSATMDGVRSAVNDMIYNPKPNAAGLYVFDTPKIFKDASAFEFYMHRGLQKLFLINNLYDTFYTIEQPFPIIDWELKQEQREIAGYACQKAIGSFKGRIYEAWFTVEIPFEFGPWKLHGLPGLILEATDSKREVSWTFTDFELLDEQRKDLINSPKQGVKTTLQKFNSLFDAVKKNPDAARKAAALASPTGRIMMNNMYVTWFSVGLYKKENSKDKKINNPLELEN